MSTIKRRNPHWDAAPDGCLYVVSNGHLILIKANQKRYNQRAFRKRVNALNYLESLNKQLK